jgi:uncharacterized protein YndB with AHSA1/START domain
MWRSGGSFASPWRVDPALNREFDMNQATAKVSRMIEAPVEEVWEAITTPEMVQAFFMGAEVDSDFQVGSPIRFRGKFKGQAYEDKGQILEAEPEKKLSFSHYSPMSGAPDAPENYHVVTYELTPEGQQTRVTLTQSNLKGGVRRSDTEHRAEYEKNWAGVLAGLSKAVAH